MADQTLKFEVSADQAMSQLIAQTSTVEFAAKMQSCHPVFAGHVGCLLLYKKLHEADAVEDAALKINFLTDLDGVEITVAVMAEVLRIERGSQERPYSDVSDLMVQAIKNLKSEAPP